MRTNNRIIVLLLAMTAMFVFAANALAVGTVAGTLINNTATVNYQNFAGLAQAPVVSNTVTTTVTQVAAVVISNTAVSNINVVPGQLAVANQFAITNNGNKADSFKITPIAATAQFTNVRYYVNPVAQATSTTFAGTATATLLPVAAGVVTTPQIESSPTSNTAGAYPNGTVIFVVVDIANNLANGTVITKTQGAGTVVSVFNAAVSNTTVVNMTDTVQAGVLTISKQVRNVTTAGAFATTASGQPGDTLEYQITVTNTGAGNAQAVVLTDPIDINTTFVAGSVVFGGTGVGSSIVSGTSTATNLAANLGTGATAAAGGVIAPAPNNVVTVTFRVTIN